MLREELYYARVHFMDSLHDSTEQCKNQRLNLAPLSTHMHTYLPPSNQVIMCIVRAFRFAKNLIGDQMLRN